MIQKIKNPSKQKYDSGGEKTKKTHVRFSQNWILLLFSPFLQEISPSNQPLYSSWREKSFWWWRPREVGVQVRNIQQLPSSQRTPPRTQVRRCQALRCRYPHCSSFSYSSSFLLSQLHWPSCCPSDLSQWCFCFRLLGLLCSVPWMSESVNTCMVFTVFSPPWGS